ncbi:MAG: hypothetical protein Q9160_008405 [Pyrenula sp. 1 TL-2023]
MAANPSHETFASDEEEGEPFIGRTRSTRRPKSSWVILHWRSIVTHTTLITANIIIYIAAMTSVWDPAHHTTPLKNAIAYEERAWDHHATFTSDGAINHLKPNSFSGPPRPALEAAWEELKSS